MTLSYKQLAFILDIEPIEAARKIIFVHCRTHGLGVPRTSHLIRDYYFKGSDWPMEMDVEVLSKHLNLPDLQMAIDDIREKYLTRQGTKKYILCDYPEKELKLKLKEQVRMPSVLASLLKPSDVEFIQNEWFKRYGITSGKLAAVTK